MGTSLLDLLGERSQNNSYGKHVIGLYLYATGISRQSLSVLSHLGLCSSYTTLAGSITSLKAGSGPAPSDDNEVIEDPDWEPDTINDINDSEENGDIYISTDIPAGE